MREMKDSGISWVGEIPNEWSVKKIKHISYVIGGNGFNVELQGLESGDYPFCKASDISNAGKYLDKAANYVTFDIVRDQHYNIIPNGAILFPKIGEAMKKNNRTICVLDCCADNNCQAIVPFERNSGMFLYYILTCVNMGWFDNAGTIPCMNNRKFLNSKVPFPSLDEQQRIAEFLDRECGKIDGLKADIQAQIDTLEQYKRSVITEAVTHGLNPSAPMKDSGIPWVGEIPAKWAVLPIYCVYGERKRKNVFGTEQNLLSLSYGKVIRKDINTNGGLLPSNYNGYNIIEKNDIIIRPTDLQNDRTSLRTGLVKEHGIITSAYIALKPKNRVSSKFYHYLLHSYDVKKVFYNMGNGVRQGLNYGEFAKLMVYYPPLDEQQEIADYLDNKCAEIEQIIADKKTQIETLDGYKKSLIYEYVTGKKEAV